MSYWVQSKFKIATLILWLNLKQRKNLESNFTTLSSENQKQIVKIKMCELASFPTKHMHSLKEKPRTRDV